MSLSEGSKSSTHYLSDTNRLNVSGKGPLSSLFVSYDARFRVGYFESIFRNSVTGVAW